MKNRTEAQGYFLLKTMVSAVMIMALLIAGFSLLMPGTAFAGQYGDNGNRDNGNRDNGDRDSGRRHDGDHEGSGELVIISGPTVIGLTGHKATIHWRTNERADGKVRFGTESHALAREEEMSRYRKEHIIVLRDLLPSTTYYYQVFSSDREGNDVASAVLTFSTRAQGPSDGSAEIGVFKDGTWYLDKNGNEQWDGASADMLNLFGTGLLNAKPVTGDWNGDGTTDIGVFVDGIWYLDMNGNGQWDGEGIDVLCVFGVGLPNAIPVAGDWNGDEVTDIGVVTNGTWYLDTNGNHAWDGEPTDAMIAFTLALAEVPVTGDWNGDGITKIGVFSEGYWYLDMNGNGRWDGVPEDAVSVFGVGLPNVIPVTGDWNGDGMTNIGAYSDGNWYLDTNGNSQWDGTQTDTYGVFGVGLGTAVPVTGNW